MQVIDLRENKLSGCDIICQCIFSGFFCVFFNWTNLN